MSRTHVAGRIVNETGRDTPHGQPRPPVLLHSTRVVLQLLSRRRIEVSHRISSRDGEERERGVTEFGEG